MSKSELFRIETDNIILAWNLLKPASTQNDRSASLISGTLKVNSMLPTTAPVTVVRCGEHSTTDLSVKHGPVLFEETDYGIWLSSKNSDSITLSHRDPLLLNAIQYKSSSAPVFHTLNFHSQVGYSDFTVMVNNQPELQFTVEVFPSKLDYKTDYQEMLAEVQQVLTALAMEYLKATYHVGAAEPIKNPTGLEWIILLKSIADDLEKALQHIALHPIRGLRNECAMTRTERIRRIDASLRSVIRRGGGNGEYITTGTDIPVRRCLPERRAKTTLNTPEHRWLSSQLNRICQRLAQLRQEEAACRVTERRKRVLAELDEFEGRMRRLSALEPLAAAEGDPPSGFSSLQLQGAHGYREAFQKCLILMLGLRIEGGPLNLSAKDISLLYEYWCFIALIRLIEEETGVNIPVKSLIQIRQQGLRVMLKQGKTTVVPFQLSDGRMISAEYNPTYDKEPVLVNQKPDIVLRLSDPQWPEMRLILDAKYRLDRTPKYKETYGAAGPPEDAINVLHRYRDAILEEIPGDSDKANPKRTIVQAVALYPHQTDETIFKESRLWKALERIGIGAIPFLPGNDKCLRDWLRDMLRQGGWSIAERAVGSIADDAVRDWRQAASEAVLVAMLRGKNPGEHLNWIKTNKIYYVPIKTTQARFHKLQRVALYIPVELRRPGAVTLWAQVDGIEVKKRREIPTPWAPSRNAEEDVFVYHLAEIKELTSPIENKDDESSKVILGGGHRWTTRLGLQRAKTLKELCLETEPEWRLYETLKACNIKFNIKADTAKATEPDDPHGRTWFVVGELRIMYKGSGGFLLETRHSKQRMLKIKEIVNAIDRY